MLIAVYVGWRGLRTPPYPSNEYREEETMHHKLCIQFPHDRSPCPRYQSVQSKISNSNRCNSLYLTSSESKLNAPYYLLIMNLAIATTPLAKPKSKPEPRHLSRQIFPSHALGNNAHLISSDLPTYISSLNLPPSPIQNHSNISRSNHHTSPSTTPT